MLIDNLFVVQGLGMLAFLTMALAFQSNVRTRILYLQVLGMGFMGLHLWLLGALTGAVMMSVLMVRNLVFLQKENYPIAGHRYIYYFFLALVFATGVYMWEGWGSIFAIGGALVATYAFWLIEPRRIRMMVLASAIVWMPYSIIFKSYPMLFLQLFLSVSILIAMWRYDKTLVGKN